MSKKTRRGIGLYVLALGSISFLFQGCALPSLKNRTTSAAFIDTDATQLGRINSPLIDKHPGKSGIYALQDARDAFTARALLAHAAERSLDVQYYIWHKDLSGTLLFKALWEAADRGVRVRFLLDDNNTSGLDVTLASLDSHPNIEVRLFNPLAIRKPRALGYLTGFFRVNRRMHNKSFTSDNQATIVGGRNVGDDYFGATEGLLFADLDVLAVGPVVNDVSNDFDRYWASESAYPIDRLLRIASPTQVAKFTSDIFQIEHDPKAVAYTSALRDSVFFQKFSAGKLPLEWTAARMVSDDPKKALGLAKSTDLFPEQLKNILGQPETDVDLVSPYLVLTASADSFIAMAKRGVKIRMLTNSLEATDVSAVHAGYAKRRKRLLRAGITLFELKHSSPESEKRERAGFMGSSRSSLHAKTFSVDRARVFIGSFNFDPRSAKLNTELGFVIDSPALAKKIADGFDNSISENSYEVRLMDNGKLNWTERKGTELVSHKTEPGTGFWKRAWVRFLSLLPIEWLL